ncbi:MAG: OmpA family protein [Nitrospirales bacterium]|nr:OmpA family protein [Nitrospirales bacterium]
MWVCPKRSTLIVAVTLGVLMASGCSSHSVRTGLNSEGDGTASSEDGNAVDTNRIMGQANGSVEGRGRNGGLVNGVKPSQRSNRSNSQDIVNGSDPNLNPEGMRGAERTFGQGGSNYGHQYPSVDGSGPNHGPVSGFENGMASSQNPDPEAWANAYLGNGKNSREFYGDPSKSGIPNDGSSQGGVNPANWAETYRKEHGGPSPEYVDPDSSIAIGHGQQRRASVGIGKTDTNGSIFESNFSGSMGIHHGQVQDIYFAFDSWNISSNAAKFLEEGAQWLQANPGKALTIEGHCDQRGTQDYNLVLGQKRADAARAYLVNLGVQQDRIKIVSYGKERPFCQNDSEDCFQENRRNHMLVRVN